MEFLRNLGSNIVMLMPQVISGLKVTLEIFAITLILSIPLGIVTAMGRRSKIKIINKFSFFNNNQNHKWVIDHTHISSKLDIHIIFRY